MLEIELILIYNTLEAW